MATDGQLEEDDGDLNSSDNVAYFQQSARAKYLKTDLSIVNNLKYMHHSKFV